MTFNQYIKNSSYLQQKHTEGCERNLEGKITTRQLCKCLERHAFTAGILRGQETLKVVSDTIK